MRRSGYKQVSFPIYTKTPKNNFGSVPMLDSYTVFFLLGANNPSVAATKAIETPKTLPLRPQNPKRPPNEKPPTERRINKGKQKEEVNNNDASQDSKPSVQKRKTSPDFDKDIPGSPPKKQKASKSKRNSGKVEVDGERVLYSVNRTKLKQELGINHQEMCDLKGNIKSFIRKSFNFNKAYRDHYTNDRETLEACENYLAKKLRVNSKTVSKRHIKQLLMTMCQDTKRIQGQNKILKNANLQRWQYQHLKRKNPSLEFKEICEGVQDGTLKKPKAKRGNADDEDESDLDSDDELKISSDDELESGQEDEEEEQSTGSSEVKNAAESDLCETSFGLVAKESKSRKEKKHDSSSSANQKRTPSSVSSASTNYGSSSAISVKHRPITSSASLPLGSNNKQVERANRPSIFTITLHETYTNPTVQDLRLFVQQESMQDLSTFKALMRNYGHSIQEDDIFEFVSSSCWKKQPDNWIVPFHDLEFEEVKKFGELHIRIRNVVCVSSSFSFV